MNGIHCALQGALGADPELRFTSTGKAILNLSVAVTDNRAGGDGAETQWVRVALWEELAEELAEVLKQGQEVYVEGKLRLNAWTGQDGQPRAQLSVSAWTCQLLGAIGRRAPRRTRTSQAVPTPSGETAATG